METSTARLRGDDEYRDGLRTDVREILSATTSTHLLTEFGILSDEPLGAGVLRRLASRMAPAPAKAVGLEALLGNLIAPADAELFAHLEPAHFEAWAEALLKGSTDAYDRTQLASAIIILATRVAGIGVEARLSERMPTLEAWNSPFIELSRRLDRFAEAYVQREGHEALADGTLGVIVSCRAQVLRFRAEKELLGTTLHLSSASLRMLQQLERLEQLVECTSPERRARAVAALGLSLSDEVCRRRPVQHFVGQKLDLLAYVVIGHAAQKGDKYAVRTRGEYLGFWGKSLFGGLLVAIFASLKLHLSHEALAPAPQAFIYGLNYAVCFALIYLLGATLATKQPALTASRIADALEEGPEHESFPELVRAIWRSQFISFLGNILGAASFAIVVAVAVEQITGGPLISHEEALTLAEKIHPFRSGSIWYAAIAGVMLSSAGFFAGFVDNGVVFHRVADRVAAGGGIFRLLPSRLRRRVASRIEKKSGALAGNILLGFMLGSAGVAGMVLGIPLDIRHIAFASSHGGLAVFYAPELHSAAALFMVIASVSIIGFVNFIVSFALTLTVAVNARRLDGVGWRSGLKGLLRLAKSNPIGFFLPVGR
ncbi:MAG: site-specific recombinase [Bradymonadia bacterium]|jgi:site-specific recombinase